MTVDRPLRVVPVAALALTAAVGLAVVGVPTSAEARTATSTISGTVTVQSGQAANVCVTAVDPASFPFGGTTRVAADGTYTLDDVPPGRWLVEFDTCDPHDNLIGTESPTVTTHAGQAVTGIDVRLERGGIVAGTLTDVAGNPPGPICISLSGVQGHVTSAHSGHYRLTGLASGEHRVIFRPCTAKAREHVGVQRYPTVVAVRKGLKTTGIDVVMSRPAG